MQLMLMLVVLGALAVAESAPGGPVADAQWRLLAACGGVALVTVFAMAVSAVIALRLRADFARQGVLLRRFRTLRRAHVALWLLTSGGILCWLDWARLVRFNWHLDRVLLVDELLILAPVLLPLVFSWAAFYEVDRAVRLGIGDDGAAGETGGRGRYVAVHLRHYLGILLVPVVLLVAWQDSVQILLPGMSDGGQALLFVPVLVLLLLLFPVLLRYVWQTHPLPPGPLRDRLQQAARRSGLRVREILVWQTDGMVVNAAVAGFVRPWRYVFLTDGLLRLLGDEQIEAVFGHEAGHVRHHHLPLRVMTMVAPLSLYLLLQQTFPQSMGEFQQWLGTAGPGVQLPLGLMGLVALAVYALSVFGYYSRLLEHQADLFGCRLAAAGPGQAPHQAFIAALEMLGAAAGASRSARSWQHASVARRVDFLNRLGRRPDRELHFQRRVRRLSILVMGILISPLAYGLLLG